MPPVAGCRLRVDRPVTDPFGRRRRLRRLLWSAGAVAALALTAWLWGVVATAEQGRTDTQVQTIRRAILGDDHRWHQRGSAPSRGGFLGEKTNGSWGVAWVPREPGAVLDDLRTAAVSATIDAPFCVAPQDRAPRDAIATRAQIGTDVYACDLTRGGRPFGWVKVTRRGVDEEGRRWSVVEYGIGPDASNYRLRALLASPAP